MYGEGGMVKKWETSGEVKTWECWQTYFLNAF